ncbi:MAG: hypothetical protein UR73_C0012G0008 [candidate division WS6 bacterium GW2011_GWF1_35_23]|uniref:Uncharacterized protein n=1 Tax=candidate division WS6 bacterium GW2011_GWF1_35_23 TaxID=1619097 RepID=A0A0G0C7R4_9BACT|nr:MAG: hypothetical protein UR73_C0012G0008 [candidate division WS6 bacterium GW2011_GWF1_35_23]
MENKVLLWYHNLKRLAIILLIAMLVFGFFSTAYGLFWLLFLVAFYLLYALLRPRFEKIQEEDWCFVIPVILICIYFLLNQNPAIKELLLQLFTFSIPIYAFVVATIKQNFLTKDRFRLRG